MKPSESIMAETKHLLEDVLPPGASHDSATRAEALARSIVKHLDQEAGYRESIYRDTEDRYSNDPAFRAAVATLEQNATRHGFTPGELKQIAFKAALNLEMRARPMLYVAKPGTIEAEQVAGYLNDGTPVFFGKAPA